LNQYYYYSVYKTCIISDNIVYKYLINYKSRLMVSIMLSLVEVNQASISLVVLDQQALASPGTSKSWHPQAPESRVQNPELEDPELEDPELEDPELEDPELEDPDTSHNNPVPDHSHSNPVSDTSHSNPVPDPSHSNPVPDPSHSNPVPDTLHSNPVPDPSHSKPVQDVQHSKSVISVILRLYVSDNIL
jgi:hypothetical protein